MILTRIAFPLRHGRPYGAGAASFTFLLAGAEFGVLNYGWATAAGEHPTLVPFALAVLPAAYLVAAAAAGVMFLVTRRRSSRIVEHVTLMPSDLESVRQRVVADIQKERAKARRAERRASAEDYAPRGRAGASRRR